MSRVEFVDTVIAPLGVNGAMTPIAGFGATPFIVNPDGSEGAQAAAYAGRIGITSASSLVTNSSGRVNYWLDPGDYNIHFGDQQVPPRIASWIQGFSATTFSIAQLIASNSPPPLGGMELFAGSVDPIDGDGITRWMICDGRAVSRTTYSDLFDVIGASFGVGDGVTTFNIPNMRGKFPLGKATAGTGSTLGGVGGSLDHTHVVPGHHHTPGDLALTPPGHHHAFPGNKNTIISDSFIGQTIANGTGTAIPNVITAPGFSASPVTADSGFDGSTAYFIGQIGSLFSGSPNGDNDFASASQNPAFLVVNYLIKVL